MTSRTRKLTVGVALLVGTALIVLVALHQSEPSLAVKFLRYDGNGVVLQLTNLSDSPVTYISWHSDTNQAASARVLKAHWGRQLIIPIAGPHQKAGVVYVPSLLTERIGLFLQSRGLRWWAHSFVISVDLSPPPPMPVI